ncbi:GNAT family N-acetyltransferase [Oceanobacillus sp. J11TS1]|uniref:GNAT family N-acetyltransferase n=1 Tax=Oceanobacillus sp. J11TS1 TaxID=2807191 RepID=UPI001B0CBC5C|nr:GNAT family protein [Oceanobacillus sp. J11TS1]GIO23301.1 N-acetyltransferase [Oceanobacillus sp. J11TS1]
MNIQVRNGTPDDFQEVMQIIHKARNSLIESGSPQWSDEDSPKEDEIKREIEKGNNYLLIIDELIIGTAIITDEEEQPYSTINYGEWDASEGKYATIHKFAIDPAIGGKGYGKLFLNLLLFGCKEKGISEIRIDTYPKNRAMQRVILSAGFVFKGIIHLPFPNGERYAYQLFLE